MSNKETDQQQDSRRFEVWERHGQSLMLSLTLGALVFTGNFMWGVNARLSEIQTDNKHLTAQVAELKGQIAALQTNYITRAEFNSINDRLRSLENGRHGGR